MELILLLDLMKIQQIKKGMKNKKVKDVVQFSHVQTIVELAKMKELL
jgi:hypothetical protein